MPVLPEAKPRRTLLTTVFLLMWAAGIVVACGRFKTFHIIGFAAAIAVSLAGALFGWRRVCLAVPALFVMLRAGAHCLWPGAASPYVSIMIPTLALMPWIIVIHELGAGRRWPKIATKIIVVIIAANLAFLAGEMIADRILPRDPYMLKPLPGSAADELYIRDPLLVRRHRPGFIGKFVHPEFHGETFTINSDGYRDGPWPDPAPDGELRILFLGDSTTVGVGLDADSTIPVKTGEALSGPKHQIRILNAAVSSYGPRQYQFQLQELYNRVHPSIVCLVFYDGNDLDDCRIQFLMSRLNGLNPGLLASERAQGYESDDDAELLHPTAAGRNPTLFDRRYWVAVSSLYRIIDARVGPLLVRAGLFEPLAVYNYPMLSAMDHDRNMIISEEYQMAKDAIGKIDAFCKEHGVSLVIVRLPTKIQTEPARFGKLLSDLGLRAGDFDRTLPGREIVEQCVQSGIATIDLLPILETSDVEGSHWFYGEGHPNRDGAAIIGAKIAELIKAKGYLEKK